VIFFPRFFFAAFSRASKSASWPAQQSPHTTTRAPYITTGTARKSAERALVRPQSRRGRPRGTSQDVCKEGTEDEKEEMNGQELGVKLALDQRMLFGGFSASFFSGTLQCMTRKVIGAESQSRLLLDQLFYCFVPFYQATPNRKEVGSLVLAESATANLHFLLLSGSFLCKTQVVLCAFAGLDLSCLLLRSFTFVPASFVSRLPSFSPLFLPYCIASSSSTLLICILTHHASYICHSSRSQTHEGQQQPIVHATRRLKRAAPEFHYSTLAGLTSQTAPATDLFPCTRQNKRTNSATLRPNSQPRAIPATQPA